MFPDGKAWLHVIKTATKFSAACSLDAHDKTYGQSTKIIELTLIECCCTMYPNYPNRIKWV